MKTKKLPKKRSSERTPAEDKLLKRVGRKIAELASKNGVSLERAAYEGDVSKGYVYDLVKGKANPSLLVLSRIAASLGVKVEDLLK